MPEYTDVLYGGYYYEPGVPPEQNHDGLSHMAAFVFSGGMLHLRCGQTIEVRQLAKSKRLAASHKFPTCMACASRGPLEI